MGRTLLTERFDQAFAFASRLHREQTRKGRAVPYLSHLMAVSALALEHGADEDETIAALLHDAVEDQGGPATRREIERRFGERVAGIVDGCTDTDQTPKPPWRERKQAFIESISSASDSVRLVVACDKLHNATCTLEDLRGEGESVWLKFRGGRDGTLWYHRSLALALEGTVPEALDRRLRQTVDALHAESDG